MNASTAIVLTLLGSATGHSYLAKPASRNLLAHIKGKENCPHCLQSGGPDVVKKRAGGVWPPPPGSHGLCGDPVQGSPVPVRLADETYLKEGPATVTYQPGDIAEFHVVVSTHHRGHYEFRICDRSLDAQTLGSVSEGQACLDAHVLERAPPASDCVVNDPRGDCQPMDPKHPGRWYLPPPKKQTQMADASFTGEQASNYPAATEVHVMRYEIPVSLSCSKCTLQWYWSSGNSCFYDGDYFGYFKGLDALGWNVKEWQPLVLESWANCDTRCCKTNGTFGEEFWNCADIAVGDGQIASSTSSTTSKQVSTTTTAALPWEPVDGGEGRACRGANTGDDFKSYYTAYSGVASLDACKVRCASASGCVGIEYSIGGRCEVWTRVGGIRSSKAATGVTCLRYGSLPETTTFGPVGSFEAVDGGNGRACRGANTGDNSASYYSAHLGVFSLDACKLRCASTLGCVGIEHSSGRCEVWTREQGIAASAAVNGYTCLRYLGLSTTRFSSSTTSTSTRASCSKAWEKCGGTGWNGPTCCVVGYQCETESEWYSQCRPTATLVQRGRGRNRLHHFLGPSLVQDGVVVRHAAASPEL